MRGGNAKGETGDVGASGLSPHARGKLISLVDLPFVRGPIPACAGETTLKPVLPKAAWAYPRMRGGNSIEWDL